MQKAQSTGKEEQGASAEGKGGEGLRGKAEREILRSSTGNRQQQKNLEFVLQVADSHERFLSRIPGCWPCFAKIYV